MRLPCHSEIQVRFSRGRQTTTALNATPVPSRPQQRRACPSRPKQPLAALPPSTSMPPPSPTPAPTPAPQNSPPPAPRPLQLLLSPPSTSEDPAAAALYPAPPFYSTIIWAPGEGCIHEKKIPVSKSRGLLRRDTRGYKPLFICNIRIVAYSSSRLRSTKERNLRGVGHRRRWIEREDSKSWPTWRPPARDLFPAHPLFLSKVGGRERYARR